MKRREFGEKLVGAAIGASIADSTAEGLKNPRTEVLPIVQYLGERGKIHQIHMRNIRGGLHRFEEVYSDEGEMDFFQVMRILRDVQFAGSICPSNRSPSVVAISRR